MEWCMWQVGQAVGGGAGGAARRRAHLLGGRDGGNRPLPGQQGGQEGRLRGGRARGGRGMEGGRGRGLRPVPPILCHRDGLDRRLLGYRGKLSGSAMKEEKKDGLYMNEFIAFPETTRNICKVKINAKLK